MWNYNIIIIHMSKMLLKCIHLDDPRKSHCDGPPSALASVKKHMNTGMSL